MKNRYATKLFLSLMLGSALVLGQSEGERLFKQVCFTCHTIGKGRLIGPDLANAQNRRPEEWIIRFVQSSQSVIKSGDTYANTLFKQYNKLIMPDNKFSAEQIRAILAYIAENSPPEMVVAGAAAGGAAADNVPVATAVSVPALGRPLSQATKENIEAGKRLFSGGLCLTNQGPTCNSCHHVKNNSVVAGGALAKDLTAAFTRLNEAGVKAILSQPPFPAMRRAYLNNPLTEDEVFDLAAFLQYVDRVQTTQSAVNYGGILFFSGVGGVLLLLILFGGIWSQPQKE